MGAAANDLPIRQRLQHWVEHLTHVLPAQAPIRDFVHHNTLHGFQHLPFPEALAAAHRLTGAATYWPEARFQAAFAAGRITRDDLLQAFTDSTLEQLDQPILRALTRRDVLLASLLLPAAQGERRLDWNQREGLLANDAVFARCSVLTASNDIPAETWQESALQRWLALCARVGNQWTLRSLLEHLSGEDVLERVRTILQRHMAAHLDLGVAAWRNPAQAQGFFSAWRASAGLDLAWELDELPGVHDEIACLPADPLDVLISELGQLIPDEALWPGYLQRLALELPGWSGMFLWRDRNPARGDGTPVNMLDYLAVRVLLERLLCADLIRRLTGAPLEFDELRGYFASNLAEFHVRDALQGAPLSEDLQHRATHLLAASEGILAADDDWILLAEEIWQQQRVADNRQRAVALYELLRCLEFTEGDAASLTSEAAQTLLDLAASLDPLARGQLWLQAYERHYREELFGALSANHGRHPPPASVSAQVILCMDDREEGTRRHLEETAPTIVTYGAAGFFGVAMYWQGLDDAQRSALCPVVVRPEHLVRESARDAALGEQHAQRRENRLRWRERLYQGTRNNIWAGPALTALAAPGALAALLANSLAPAWIGDAARRWRGQYERPVATGLQLTAEADAAPASADQPRDGFDDQEQVDRIEAFLRSIGLTEDFAPLVLFLGHGSGSRNNPHLSAYDCGACSGRHGGPNGRVFAAMANRPEVRAGLLARGLEIPASCWFIAAEHNTCDDSVEWYDLDLVPPEFESALDTLVGQLAEACRAHAAERCRRLASAPPGVSPWQGFEHVRGRANDISQARPELGHATNAAAFIGRRAMSRGLFLDRRVFLVSYDPLADLSGQIIESVLLSVGPVGAGIALEYYFSTVDNEHFGCGSKITHNITGLFGVMEGADSDLRTGLPWQMVEIHEPMRLLVVVEQTTALLTEILSRQPALQELINNAWIILAAKDPLTATIEQYCPHRGWLPWSGSSVMPQVARSHDWFAGCSEALAPAMLLGTA